MPHMQRAWPQSARRRLDCFPRRVAHVHLHGLIIPSRSPVNDVLRVPSNELFMAVEELCPRLGDLETGQTWQKSGPEGLKSSPPPRTRLFSLRPRRLLETGPLHLTALLVSSWDFVACD
jgi:hypothetical protein